MRITSVWAKNFKSFGPRQSIRVPQLALLVGPNNAGKSNALEIAAALKMFLARPLDMPPSLLRSGAESARVGIEFEHGGSEGSYEVTFRPRWRTEAFKSGSSNFVVNEHGALVLPNVVGPFGIGGDCGLGVAAQQRNIVEARELLAVLAGYDIWRLNPAHIDNPAQVQRVVKLGPRGEHAPAMLDHLRDRFPEAYATLQRDLQACAPEISHVVAEASEQNPGHKEIYFHEKGGTAIPARHASEGLKFLLFVLLLVHSPDPPRFFALEEIEHGMHPRRLQDVIGFLRRLTRRPGGPQILLTSHSPIVLDQFRESPDEVVVLERAEAGTVCTPLSKKLANVEAWRETALGDLWYSGVLGGVPAS